MGGKTKILIIAAVVVILLAASGAYAMTSDTPLADRAKGLSDKQRAMARIIESELRAAGFGPKVVAAGIANAQAESGLNPLAIGDKGKSVGLFQLNIAGAGHGMTVEARQDPTTNVRTIITRELQAPTSFGKKFRAVADSPTATAGDVTEAWCRFVERPKNPDTDSAKRRIILAGLWPSGDLT